MPASVGACQPSTSKAPAFGNYQMADQRSTLERHGFPITDLEFDQGSTRPRQDIDMQRRDDLELGHRSARHHQDIGTTKSSLPRAKWNHQMKMFLIEQLKDYNVPGYRTQNAWSKEAWTCIVNRMNQKFSLSLTLAQVKQKEQDLKKDFRSVKDLVCERGFGCDGSCTRCNLETFGERRNKDAVIWRDKSFPYFDDLFALYEGRYADGKNRHGMDHYANKAKKPSHVPSAYSPPEGTDMHVRSPSPTMHGVDEPYMHFPLEEEYEIGTTDFSQRPSKPPMPSTHMPSKSVTTPEMHESKGTKRKKNNEFQERYLKLKKEEIDRFPAIEEKKLEDPYSIPNCVKALEGLQDLQMSDLLMAADIFKTRRSFSRSL